MHQTSLTPQSSCEPCTRHRNATARHLRTRPVPRHQGRTSRSITEPPACRKRDPRRKPLRRTSVMAAVGAAGALAVTGGGHLVARVFHGDAGWDDDGGGGEGNTPIGVLHCVIRDATVQTRTADSLVAGWFPNVDRPGPETMTSPG